MLPSTFLDVPSNDKLSLKLKHWIINRAEMLLAFAYTRLNAIHTCNVLSSTILATLLYLCHFQWTVNLIACLQIFFFHWLNYQKPVWWMYHFLGLLGLQCTTCNALKCICTEYLLNIFCKVLLSPLERHPHTSQTDCSWLEQQNNIEIHHRSFPHGTAFQSGLDCKSKWMERSKKKKIQNIFSKSSKCTKKWSF